MENSRPRWATVKCNDQFICVETLSGYRFGTVVDFRAPQLLLAADASNDLLGAAVTKALSASRIVLGEPGPESRLRTDIEFDRDLYDYKLTADRYATWKKNLMTKYGYKTQKALFKGMKSCTITMAGSEMTIKPFNHDRLEGWSSPTDMNMDGLVFSADDEPTVGLKLRLALSRCE